MENKKVFDYFGDTMGMILNSINPKPKKFRFETIDEAEEWYEENLDNDSNNMNEAFEGRRDSWLEEVSDSIKESYEENNKK